MNQGIDLIQEIDIIIIMRDTGGIPLDKGTTTTVYAMDIGNLAINVIKKNAHYGVNTIKKRKVRMSAIKCVMVIENLGTIVMQTNAQTGV